ncbi:beta-1,3-glucanase family protein [Streptomyces sp. NBC_00828]
MSAQTCHLPLASPLLSLVIAAVVIRSPSVIPATLSAARELASDGTLTNSIIASSRRILIGWGLGVAVGVPVGLLVGQIKVVRQLLDPYIEFFRFIPPIAFVTLAVVWLGIGESSKVVLIFYTAFFIVTLNTSAGVMAVNESKLRAAASLGASRRQMRLHSYDGYDVQVGETQAFFAKSRTQVFQDFNNAVPQEFKVLAQSQAPYRIIAPGSDASFKPGGVNANYFTAYAQSVGVNEMTQYVFGCAGTMAGNPNMCAALNRHVATLPSSGQADPNQYYLSAPANYYAKFWHDNAINKLAYGFPYDDVASQSSFISHANPQWLSVAAGF